MTPWLQGTTADAQPPLAHQAKPFAQFLRALHTTAPHDAPVNEVRGVPLQQRSAGIEARMQRLVTQTDLITPAITRVWQQALSAVVNTKTRWLHGDLHPRNILVNDGVISGIIDWGDITSGDVATDLAAIWMLFAAAATRAQALTQYGAASEAMLQRARGWAVLFGVVLLDTGLVDNPRHATIGASTLRRIAEF